MKVLMLGNYDINEYSRGRILYKGLKRNNVKTSIFLPINNKYFKLTKRILKKDYDVLLVTGKPVLFLSWLLKPFHRKKILFDMFISDYDNLVNDRKLIKKNSIKAKLLWLIDKYSCNLSDKIILDTNEHIKYFVKEFKINSKKFNRILVGADNDFFKPTKTKLDKGFVVEFHGTFIPLQGIEYIINAAKLLEEEDIKFRIIGIGQEHKRILKLAKNLKLRNIYFSNKNISLENLSKEINSADICLGIFGRSDKTQKVIPNKAFEIIACKKPLITSKTPAIKELFQNKKNCVLCKISDSDSLANSILYLKKDKKLREKISKEGYKLFKQETSIVQIGKDLKKSMEKYNKIIT
tara:strand:+ start:812 stop:1864 length:1053 start_codon:yes stop_codon:yes gene_type:complete